MGPDQRHPKSFRIEMKWNCTRNVIHSTARTHICWVCVRVCVCECGNQKSSIKQYTHNIWTLLHHPFCSIFVFFPSSLNQSHAHSFTISKLSVQSIAIKSNEIAGISILCIKMLMVFSLLLQFIISQAQIVFHTIFSHIVFVMNEKVPKKKLCVFSFYVASIQYPQRPQGAYVDTHTHTHTALNIIFTNKCRCGI